MLSEAIEFANLRPGMRLSVHTANGILAGRAIATTQMDDDGGCLVTFEDGTTLYEDPERMSYRSTLGIAKEV